MARVSPSGGIRQEAPSYFGSLKEAPLPSPSLTMLFRGGKVAGLGRERGGTGDSRGVKTDSVEYCTFWEEEEGEEGELKEEDVWEASQGGGSGIGGGVGSLGFAGDHDDDDDYSPEGLESGQAFFSGRATPRGGAGIGLKAGLSAALDSQVGPGLTFWALSPTVRRGGGGDHRTPAQSRMIPSLPMPLGGGGAGTPQQNQSAPVKIPDWSRILKAAAPAPPPVGPAHADENEEIVMLPPHELLARDRTLTNSMCEGAGRTLKGRDLSRVRNAVLRQTGFID